jgi:hypothetical protein
MTLPGARAGDQLEEAQPALGGAAAAEPPAAIPTDDVRFTAFFPKEATVETWYTLLVYAHVEAALAKVQADAARFKDEMAGVPREARAATPARLARGTEIAIVPTCAGVTFNPERVSFKWVEDMHRADFRMQASKDLAGLADNVLVTIYVGPLIVATIKGGISFNEATSAPLVAGSTTQATTTLYRSEQIFPSYSHKDEDIVIACRDAYEAIGWEFLRDRDTLRPGEDWNARLMQLIEQADIFQLFWSDNSARSPYCKQEWEHALGLQDKKVKGSDFIRPVYWKLPWVQPPAELSKFHFTYKPLAKP